MPTITALYSTAAALPSLALYPTSNRRCLSQVRSWAPARGNSLPPPRVISQETEPHSAMPDIKASSLLLQCGALMACVSVAQPAFALTGNNNLFDDDLPSLLIQAAVVAVGYFLVMPPVIFNWLRLRWYKRKFFEMYLQFMLVFIFFPGMLLWAPFLNFRRFPRDPTMKYPWSIPKDVSTNNPGS